MNGDRLATHTLAGRAHRSAIEALLADPHRQGFFETLRLIERWIARQEGGRADETAARRVRLHHTLSMGFPASEIAGLQVHWRATALLQAGVASEPGFGDPLTGETTHRSVDAERIDITPAFLGLLGAAGTLPSFYTELFAEREHLHRDTAGRAFLDIFLHRAGMLLYRAWLKHRLPLQFEADRRQRFLPMVLSLAGLGQEGLRRRLRPAEGGVADDSLAYFAGLIQLRPRSAAAVQAIVQRYFGVPVKLTEFVGRWVGLPAEHQCRLGLNGGSLGVDTMLGERVWQRDLRVRLDIGPMEHRRFLRFLPGGTAALALRQLLTLLTGVMLEYEIRLVLRAADVRPARISAKEAPRLGWDSFLVTRGAVADRNDAGYDLHTMA